MIGSLRVVYLRQIVRLLVRRVGGMHKLAELVLVPAPEIWRILEVGSRLDRDREDRLVAFFERNTVEPPGGWPEARGAGRRPAIEPRARHAGGELAMR